MFSFLRASPDEAACLEEMRTQFPDETELTLQRFCVARNFNSEKASSMLRANLEWRSSILPIDRESCREEIDKGLFTHRGFDKQGRPVFLYHGSKYDSTSISMEEVDRVIKSVIVSLEEGLAAQEEGTDGKLIVVLYVNSGSKFDTRLIKQFAKTMSDNYPERCFRALIFPGTPLAMTLWRVASFFFDPRTREKVIIVPNKAEGRDVFADLIADDQLEIMFRGWGGTPWGKFD